MRGTWISGHIRYGEYNLCAKGSLRVQLLLAVECRYLLSAAKEIMSQLKTEWGEYSRDLQSFYVQFKNESDDII